MENASKTAMICPGRVRELRCELAGKIASFMGSAENKATDIPRGDAPSADGPYPSVPDDLPSERHRGGSGPQAGEPRPDLLHL